MQGIAEVIRAVRRKGVVLWSEAGELRFRGPKGALTREELEKLRAARSHVIALLESSSAAWELEPPLKPREHAGPVPLSYSQLAHWNLWRLAERPSIRQVAMAIRLRGRLDVPALRSAFAFLVQRHEALRTRVIAISGVPMQVVDTVGSAELEQDDPAGMDTTALELEVSERIQAFVHRPVEVGVGPLFAAKLIRLAECEHVLVLATEHLISDGCSLNILLTDLMAAYEQAVSGRPMQLAPVPIQLADYAEWQSRARKYWQARHGSYWKERLKDARALRFPRSRIPRPWERASATVPVRIENGTREKLRAWCRERRTTSALGVLAAYCALMMRWCAVPEAVFRFVSDGREDLRTEHTVGFFATVLYLRIFVREKDSFPDLVARVTAEYCAAREHADHSLLASREPPPPYAGNPVFNWAPQGNALPELAALKGTDHAVDLELVPIVIPLGPDPNLEREPSILLFDRPDALEGDLYFPARRVDEEAIRQFGASLETFLREVLDDPHRPLQEVAAWDAREGAQ